MWGWGEGRHPGAEEPGKGQPLSCLADRSEPLQWPEDVPSPCTSLDLSGHRTRVDVRLVSLADGREEEGKAETSPASWELGQNPGHQRAKGQEVDSDAPTMTGMPPQCPLCFSSNRKCTQARLQLTCVTL